MNIENKWKSQTREDDLMSQEELDAWKKYLSEVDRNNDPLELLGKNKGINKREISLKGGGPDDGDGL